MDTLPRFTALCLLAFALAAHADEEEPPLQLTTGIYSVGGAGTPSATAYDVDLRYRSDAGEAWIGAYRDRAFGMSLLRAGWVRTFELGAIRVQPTLQIASRGFLGGNLYLETGDTWFAGAGIGRTNLRPYQDLNFDPNDAWTLSGGYRWTEAHELSLTLIGDNRQNPDERHLHVLWRTPSAEGERLTVDVLAKRGLVSGQMIHKVGLSVGYAWPRVFARIVWDPRVNFTPRDMLRLQAGLRF
ncbi:MAG TPA: hypothetical protein VHA82_09505 [Ramlibacter sp.]|uniref:hypothetical protein n=1 Tax=Ramlibacter sp. TaxID=1917967 RepID=UPI002B92FB6C|nr:hypothetical protein [Ramlibacter sp.]HVZ44035.1 hypothetical protein [Ramlibacter sp.]